MVKLGRAHAVQLVRFLFALLAWASVAVFAPGAASAGPLEGVTRPVEYAVGAPVEEVTETVTGAVPEVTETVTPRAEETVEQVSPPVEEVTERVTHPPKEATAKLPPPVKEATEKLPSPAKGAAEAAGGRAATSAVGAVHETAGAANQGVRAAGGGVRSADQATPPPTDGAAAAGGLDAAPTDAIGSRDPRRSSTSARPDLGPGNDSFEVPSRGGAVRAPLPKWVAYVWPAIALVRPALADLISRWERQGQLRAIEGTGTGHSAAGEGPIVAGAHAQGGRSAASDSPSSSSPFPQIPSAIGQALTSESPTPLLAYLCLVAIAVVAIFWAVSREIVGGRRRDQ